MEGQEKGAPFGLDLDSEASGARVWAFVLLSCAVGFFASAFSLALGVAWLWVLLSYIGAGVSTFALLLVVGSFVLEGDRSSSISVARRLRAVDRARVKGVDRATVLRSSICNWTQRAPVDLAVDDGRIFCVASTMSGGLGLSIAEAVADKGYHVDVCDNLHEALYSITRLPSRWSLVIVDFDECERSMDLDEIVDELACFRSDTPHIPIITLSSGFARDDFGLERLAISDLSIRLPATTNKIFDSVRIACDNNIVWRARARGEISVNP